MKDDIKFGAYHDLVINNNLTIININIKKITGTKAQEMALDTNINKNMTASMFSSGNRRVIFNLRIPCKNYSDLNKVHDICAKVMNSFVTSIGM